MPLCQKHAPKPRSPYYWVTHDGKLRHKRDLEMLQSDLAKATNANSYSWIKKGNITKDLAGNSRRILDVGCGWGRELVRFDNAVGIDSCLLFLETARNYTGNPVLLSDAHRLPFRDRSFDLVIMSEVLEHLIDPCLALKEAGRVLEGEGKIVIQTPNRSITRGKAIAQDYGHLDEFTPSELIALLETCGFTILKLTGSTMPYPPSSSLLTRLTTNRYFFSAWKLLDRLCPLKWDTIILALKRCDLGSHFRAQ